MNPPNPQVGNQYHLPDIPDLIVSKQHAYPISESRSVLVWHSNKIAIPRLLFMLTGSLIVLPSTFFVSGSFAYYLQLALYICIGHACLQIINYIYQLSIFCSQIEKHQDIVRTVAIDHSDFYLSSQDGIFSKTPLTRIFYAYTRKDHLIVAIDAMHLHVLPKSCFKSPEDFEKSARFFAQANKLRPGPTLKP